MGIRGQDVVFSATIPTPKDNLAGWSCSLYNILTPFVAKRPVKGPNCCTFCNKERKEAGSRQQLLHFLQHHSTEYMDSFVRQPQVSIYDNGFQPCAISKKARHPITGHRAWAILFIRLTIF